MRQALSLCTISFLVACAASQPPVGELMPVADIPEIDVGGASRILPAVDDRAGVVSGSESERMVIAGPDPIERPATRYQEAERALLPSPFPVWHGGFGVINHGHAGGAKALLPTDNSYVGAPGCYVACYTHSLKGSIYQVTPTIGVKGQFRTPGRYQRRVCHPKGWEGKDISAAGHFKRMCDELVPACSGDCWAGGDTGGWFGLGP